VVVVPAPVVVVVAPPGVVAVVAPPGTVAAVPPVCVVPVVMPVTAVTGPGIAAAQAGLVKVSVSNVTAPLRARARPCTVTPVVTVMEVRARMLPAKTEPVPRVAELPICQNTLHACAPLISFTVLPEAVISVESVWKMKTELGSPAPLRVSCPVSPKGEWAGPA
jgi:hypothetical protein